MKSKISVNRKKLVSGFLLLALGLLMPAIFPQAVYGIIGQIERAAGNLDTGRAMAASVLLVLLNTIRSLPNYLGCFLVIQSVRTVPGSRTLLKNIIFTVIIIPAMYFLIERIYGIRYDFAVPAVLMIAAVLVVDRLDFSMVSVIKEILMIVMLIMTIQFLDVMPGLSSSLFGRGELSSDIRSLTILLGAEKLMRGMCIAFMSIFGLFTLLLIAQISLENQLKTARMEAEQEREQLIETRMQLLSSRMNKEQQFLVHDLKAPLTSIQIWADLLGMKCSKGICDECRSYLDHINGSLAHMNTLISEIMNSKARSVFTVGDVIKLFSSQISPSHYNSCVEIKSECDGAKLEINRTNFVRALINLTENASHAIDQENGKITVSVFSENGKVVFSVEDDGCGIPEEMLDSIWDKGISGRDSSGMGLAFVKEVITGAGGSVSISSIVGKGTEVRILMTEYAE